MERKKLSSIFRIFWLIVFNVVFLFMFNSKTYGNDYLSVPSSRYSLSPYLQKPFLFLHGFEETKSIKLDLSLALQYQREPFRLYLIPNPAQRQSPILDYYQMRVGLSFAYMQWFDIALVFPVAYITSGDLETIIPIDNDPKGWHILDPEMFLLVPMFHKRFYGFGLSLVGHLLFPVGKNGAFVQEKGWRGDTLAVVDFKYRDFSLVLNTGLSLRETYDALDTNLGSEFLVRPGISYSFTMNSYKLAVSLEANFSTSLDSFFGKENVESRQVLLSLNLLPSEDDSGLYLGLGGGSKYLGDDGGYAVPQYHIDGRIGYSIQWGREKPIETSISEEDCSIVINGCKGFPIYRFTFSGCPQEKDYQWNFGDGKSAVENNPQHKYYEPGTYSVSLSRGAQIITQTELKVTDYPEKLKVDNISCRPVDGSDADRICAGEDMKIECEFSSNAVSFNRIEWSWGDGATSTGRNGVHSYSKSGDYTIGLVTETCGMISEVELEEPIKVECCNCKIFKMAELSYRSDCPLAIPDGDPLSYIDKPGCPAISKEAKASLVAKKRSILEKLVIPNSRLFLVGYADICFHGESGGGDKYNEALSFRRASAVLDVLEKIYGKDLTAEMPVVLFPMGRLCANPKCDCKKRSMKACAKDRRVEVYVDFGDEVEFKCPQGRASVRYRTPLE